MSDTTASNVVAVEREYKHFEFSVTDKVATLTLNRPEKLNALTFEIYADLRDLLGELVLRDDIGALVITGNGRGFCSGGDVHEIIGELQTMDVRDLLAFTRMTGAVVQRMRECPVPIIAAVNGIAAGAGSVIALAADFRLMGESGSFAFLFTRVGLAGADMGAAYLLPRLVGLQNATELLLLGDKIDSARARELGLVNRVVEDGALRTEAAALAQRLADGPRLAHATTKVLLTRELDSSLGAAIEMEAVAQALLMKSDDHAEFYRAFVAGRTPEWTGR